jgi:hypothetical protein
MSKKQEAEAVENALGGYKAEPLRPVLVAKARVKFAGMTLDWADYNALIDMAAGDYKTASLLLGKQLLERGLITPHGQPTAAFAKMWDEAESEIFAGLEESSKLTPIPYKP